MTQERFLALLHQYIAGNLTDADMQEWLDAFSHEEYRLLFEQHMQNTFSSFETSWTPETKLEVLKTIRRQTAPSIFKKLRWAAAALVIITAGYFILNNKQKPAPVAVTTTPQPIQAPQSNRAVITLANGQQVFLDSVGNGAVASQGNVQVTKLAGGQIAYSGNSAQLSYNTLYNPKGSRVITMAFSDGSRVWLNAGSTLRYPIAFMGKERKVEISGEAYFEVAHNKTMPFRVVSHQQTIEVLGTHFNVNAYPDEAAVRTTLLEGRVKINETVLKPGQQSVLSEQKLTIHNDVDLDEVMAWKNDRFIFGEKADVGAIMRQISRWYNVEVAFKGNIDQHLGGSISRYENVEAVLKMLEKTGVVRFTVDGRQVTVLPYSPE